MIARYTSLITRFFRDILKNVSVLTNTLLKLNLQKLNEFLRIFEIIKQNFSSITKRKKLFPCTCFVLDSDIILEKMNQKLPFGGLIR